MAQVQMKHDNPSFVLHGIENVKFEERPVPEIQDDQVLVEVRRTGICGSDVHYLTHGRIGDYVLEKPMCLGHESSGVIAKIGAAVKPEMGLKVGDRVALEPGRSCRKCPECKKGKYELCQFMDFAATPPSIYGTLARYYALPADLAHPIPDSVTFEDGAMVEPLSVGVHSVSTLGQLKSNEIVVIFGAGPVGLMCMAVARALGSRKVIAVDINDDRLKFAKSYAATDVYKPGKKNEGESDDDYSVRAAKELREALGVPQLGRGSIDLAVDCTGAPSCIQMSLHLLKPAGTFVGVGMGHNMNINVPFFPLINKQLKMIGSFRYGTGDYELAISLVERGLVDLKPIKTQQYEFDHAMEAFEATKKGKDANGKTVIKCIINGPK
ncbi:sorbitol dehydrogenase [Kockovaella imperatae]|uniref:Sorbitol dehydrogenase n=1 Tax=Kockovaella imperatae TaxID=4999 RepID=A0A1Y1UFZ1_9TREE|nr:sorbitol dehydrogenase [Kockovaella imperatae]ORX36932.1 sorbitol dehydrogenase [Kockovaella imperatae]